MTRGLNEAVLARAAGTEDSDLLRAAWRRDFGRAGQTMDLERHVW